MRKNWLLIVAGSLLTTGIWAQAPSRFDGPNPSGPQPDLGWIQPVGPPLYDNGATDGTNGYSNGTAAAVGVNRFLLDDFVVPGSEIWEVLDYTWTHVWNSLSPPQGTGVSFEIVADAAGMPDIGTVIGTANVTTYTEVATGNIFFSRPEAESFAAFDPIILASGTYWFQMQILGPENNFYLVRSTVTGNELWVNYVDEAGLQSGTAQFGVAADLNFRLGGNIIIPAELVGFEVE